MKLNQRLSLKAILMVNINDNLKNIIINNYHKCQFKVVCYGELFKF